MPGGQEASAAISALYRGLLGRDPDVAGLESFLAIWGDGAGAETVVRAILESEERSQYVDFQLHGPRIAVAHIPKCAGTALHLALVQLPGAYRGPKYNDACFQSPNATGSMSARVRAGFATVGELANILSAHRVFIGHVRVSAFIEAGATQVLVPMREPNSRVLSLYRYWQSLSEPELSEWGERGEQIRDALCGGFGGFLRSEAIRADVYGAMARQVAQPLVGLSWNPRRLADHWAQVEPHVQRAYWTNETQQLVDDVGGQVKATLRPIVSHANITPPAMAEESISPEDLGVLNALTAPDRKLIQLLVRAGKLTAHSSSHLRGEFRQALANHGFRIV